MKKASLILLSIIGLSLPLLIAGVSQPAGLSQPADEVVFSDGTTQSTAISGAALTNVYSFAVEDTNRFVIDFIPRTSHDIQFVDVTHYTHGGTRSWFIGEMPYTSRVSEVFTTCITGLTADISVASSNSSFSGQVDKKYFCIVEAGSGTNFSLSLRASIQ